MWIFMIVTNMNIQSGLMLMIEHVPGKVLWEHNVILVILISIKLYAFS